MGLDLRAVAGRLRLASLKTGRPRFTRLHKPETEALTVKHHTDAGRVSVRSCDDPRLLEHDGIVRLAREAHMRLTRPSIDGLARLLPNGLFTEYNDTLRDLRVKAEAVQMHFLHDYDNLAATAPQRLNGLYDPAVWKPLTAITAKFVWDVRHLPCPVEGEWSEWLSASLTAAQQELRQQLLEAVQRVAARCAAQGPLYETVFSNLRDILDLVPDLDLTNDPVIRGLAQRARPLAGVDRSQLTVNGRKAVAEEADRILAAFGGGRAGA